MAKIRDENDQAWFNAAAQLRYELLRARSDATSYADRAASWAHAKMAFRQAKATLDYKASHVDYQHLLKVKKAGQQFGASCYKYVPHKMSPQTAMSRHFEAARTDYLTYCAPRNPSNSEANALGFTDAPQLADWREGKPLAFPPREEAAPETTVSETRLRIGTLPPLRRANASKREKAVSNFSKAAFAEAYHLEATRLKDWLKQEDSGAVWAEHASRIEALPSQTLKHTRPCLQRWHVKNAGEIGRKATLEGIQTARAHFTEDTGVPTQADTKELALVRRTPSGAAQNR